MLKAEPKPDRAAETTELRLYRRLLLARTFEERLSQECVANTLPGGLMQSIGQEAIGVGVGVALRPGDLMRSWVRGISQAIGFGVPLRELAAEIFGRATGTMQGRGGFQFLAWPEGGFLGGSGVVGSVLPVAAGHALAQKMRGRDNVTVCYLGEGALHIGPTHEAFNLAGLWRLPIIYVCENNGYALSATWDKQTAGPLSPQTRADLYGLYCLDVDGNDVEAVRDAAQSAREVALHTGPVFLHARTYRLAQFSTGETGTLGNYVSDTYRAEARAHDPLPRYCSTLMGRGALSANIDEEMHQQVTEQVEDAVTFALASPQPDVTNYSQGVLN